MSNKLLATIGVVGALVTACPDTNITDSGVDGRTVDGQQDMDTGAGGQPEAGNDALLSDGLADLPWTKQWPQPCGKAVTAAAGSLCGGAGAGCTVLVDEVLPHEPYTSEMYLSVGLDGQPRAVLGATDKKQWGGFFYQRVGADNWATWAGASPAQQGLAPAMDGSTHMLFNHSQTKNVGLYRGDAKGKKWLEDLPGNPVFADGLAADQGGCLHASLMVDKQIVYGLRDAATGKWSYKAIAQDPSFKHQNRWLWERATILSPAGRPHIAYVLKSGSTTATLNWVASPGNPVKIVSLPASADRVEIIGLAVGGSSGASTAHILFVENPVKGVKGKISYARQSPAGGWTIHTVATFGPYPCPDPPSGSSDTCPFDHTWAVPLAVVASPGGDVRLFHSIISYQGNLKAQCTYPEAGVPFDSGVNYCKWTGNKTVDGKLMMAVPDSTGLNTTTLKTGVAPVRGLGEMDSKGRIHLLMLTAGGKKARYIQLGIK